MGVSATIMQPTLAEEISALKTLSREPDVSIDNIIETLIIEKFIQDIPEATEPAIYDNRHDIIDAYKTLPAKDKRDIHSEYLENFGKYGVELKMVSFCQHCGYDEEVTINLVDQFFRMVWES